MVNTIYPTFAKKLGLSIRSTNARAQKINSTTLDIKKMVIAVFLISDKGNQVRFFKEIFLVANVSLNVIFGLLFLILNDTNIHFLD